MELRLDPDLPPVSADADKIHRVIVNLLNNAEKFASEEAVIRITAEKEADRVRIRVEDNGPGIPPEERGIVFERFRRGSAAVRTRARGTGIGLSLVKQILNAHGTDISVGDSDLGGASFSFTLPLHRSEAPSAETASETGPKLVLVVEDDREISGLLVAALKDVGYRVTAAESLDEARRNIAISLPDLVVLDLQLPDGNGLELVEELKYRTGTASVPVIAMSAYSSSTRAERARNLGVHTFLSKPFTIQELARKVTEALAQ